MNINHKTKKKKKKSCFHKMKKNYQIRKTLLKTHERKKVGIAERTLIYLFIYIRAKNI
jgi:hypothetical protein